MKNSPDIFQAKDQITFLVERGNQTCGLRSEGFHFGIIAKIHNVPSGGTFNTYKITKSIGNYALFLLCVFMGHTMRPYYNKITLPGFIWRLDCHEKVNTNYCAQN